MEAEACLEVREGEAVSCQELDIPVVQVKERLAGTDLPETGMSGSGATDGPGVIPGPCHRTSRRTPTGGYAPNSRT